MLGVEDCSPLPGPYPVSYFSLEAVTRHGIKGRSALVLVGVGVGWEDHGFTGLALKC